jgi:hypothetical protein
MCSISGMIPLCVNGLCWCGHASAPLQVARSTSHRTELVRFPCTLFAAVAIPSPELLGVLVAVAHVRPCPHRTEACLKEAGQCMHSGKGKHGRRCTHFRGIVANVRMCHHTALMQSVVTLLLCRNSKYCVLHVCYVPSSALPLVSGSQAQPYIYQFCHVCHQHTALLVLFHCCTRTGWKMYHAQAQYAPVHAPSSTPCVRSRGAQSN